MLVRKQRNLRFSYGFLLLLIFPIAWVYKYYYIRLPVSVCLFKTVTGIPCPFCGLTRAFTHSIHGDFQKAFVFHPLWWLAALILLCFIIILFYEGFTGSDLLVARLRVGQNFFWVFIVFAVITVITRFF
jgi:hypothetical protein